MLLRRQVGLFRRLLAEAQELPQRIAEVCQRFATGGAIGYLVGLFLHTTAAGRRVLLACGAAAGMAAIFSPPIAAAVLAIELFLFGFKARSFIPLVIASTLAAIVPFLRGREADVHRLCR